MNIRISPNYQKIAIRAILSIALFIIIYFLLVLLATGLTIICVAGGVALIMAKPNLLTLALGIGLSSLGFFILTFLFKFVTKKHTIDNSDLIEITKDDEPRIFQFIHDIVLQVGTNFPNRIYLSPDVNAGVFYDSSFWSMFLPVKKNLHIGIGLIKTISSEELKAILAHEFGHFSQRSMKVGSYVYYVNKILYDLLFDNDNFDKIVKKWINFSSYFIPFTLVAIKIVKGIQWILNKMYDLINISYRALSREMEFHADEVAANITGALQIKDSLLRMEMADFSYQTVLNFYTNKISDNIRSKNVFREQQFVMNFLAEESKLKFKNELPVVTEYDLNKYNKTKINIKDQWASHPSIIERINALNKVRKTINNKEDKPAINLFLNSESVEEKLTNLLFSKVSYTEIPKVMEFVEFSIQYIAEYSNNIFPKEYNGYYDYKNPVRFELEEINNNGFNYELDFLFNKEKVDFVYEHLGLLNDKNLLVDILEGKIPIKTFDYDGRKYDKQDVKSLIYNLNKQLEKVESEIRMHDLLIYKYFFSLSKFSSNIDVFTKKYMNFQTVEDLYNKRMKLWNKIMDFTGFVHLATPYEDIEFKFKHLIYLENELKEELQNIVDNRKQYGLTDSVKQNFEKYLSNQLKYFNKEIYIDENLQLFFDILIEFRTVNTDYHFKTKKDLLEYQIDLIGTKHISVRSN